MSMRARQILAAGVVAGLALAACGGGGRGASTGGAYRPTIRPADFSTRIDNPFLPLTPGTRMIYEGNSPDGRERIVVDVTRDTKTIAGVNTVVVRDTVSVDGKVVEDTFDWYAQHRAGSVWYFGEATRKIESGVTSTEGSWEAGVDGAQPGVVMPAHPKVGATYRQEYYKGHAEDRIDILSLRERATVPFGSLEGLVKTKDYSALEPDVVENKYYARGIGFVLVVHVKGPAERIELVGVERT
jgi:hypothetical protein